MKAAIVNVGTELLFGQTVNTNAVYLSRELQNLGIDVLFHFIVGDNEKRLTDTLKIAEEQSDIIICTGGLGPTQDDITGETIAKVAGAELIQDKDSVERLNEYFDRLGRKMTENNYKQTYFPEGSVLIENTVGTAAGFRLEHEGKIFIAMPGPPRELKRMFEDKVKVFLQSLSSERMYYKVIRTFGIGESMLESELSEYITGQTDPTLATYAKEGECTLRIASKRNTVEEAKLAVGEMTAKVLSKIGEYVYSEDDEDLNTVVAKKLIKNKIGIASAESCTAGMFADKLADTPDISTVYNRGYVTYSNDSKISDLGVDPETLEKYGAVSRETAIEMALGVKAKSGARVGISVTGIAGPGGGTEEKPVGLVYICVAFDGEYVCEEIKMRNLSRKWNRNYATLSMFDLLNKTIDKYLSESGKGS